MHFIELSAPGFLGAAEVTDFLAQHRLALALSLPRLTDLEIDNAIRIGNGERTVPVDAFVDRLADWDPDAPDIGDGCRWLLENFSANPQFRDSYMSGMAPWVATAKRHQGAGTCIERSTYGNASSFRGGKGIERCGSCDCDRTCRWP